MQTSEPGKSNNGRVCIPWVKARRKDLREPDIPYKIAGLGYLAHKKKFFHCSNC